MILSANEEESFLTYSDTALTWSLLPQACAANMREGHWREMQGVVHAELCQTHLLLGVES